jgi:hypothetical protein
MSKINSKPSASDILKKRGSKKDEERQFLTQILAILGTINDDYVSLFKHEILNGKLWVRGDDPDGPKGVVGIPVVASRGKALLMLPKDSKNGWEENGLRGFFARMADPTCTGLSTDETRTVSRYLGYTSDIELIKGYWVQKNLEIIK